MLHAFEAYKGVIGNVDEEMKISKPLIDYYLVYWKKVSL